MDTAWIITRPDGSFVTISAYDGWKVDVVMSAQDDMFSALPGKLEPIEDEL